MEDGEIIDDEVEDYTPLQRPTEMDNPRPVVPVEESEPSAEEESESEDSDDPQRGQKKQKLKPSMMNNMREQSTKSKKYNVWCSGIQEEVLTQELTNCEVAQRFERNRDVESYDYTRYRGKDEELGESCTSNKRQYDDRQQQGVRSRLGRRRHSSEGLKGKVRSILGLTTTIDSTDEEIARDIANKLCEEKDELILRIVQVLGKEKAIEIFEKTKEIEETGGLLIMNQTRRRTAGGVFLFQVKSNNDQEMNQKIFIDDRRQYDAQKRTERSKIRRDRAHRLQKELQAENLMGEPSRLRSDPLSGEDEELGGGGVSNPPPSPVTDGRADSSPEPCPVMPLQAAVVQAAAATSDIPARTLTTYDDFLDLNASFEEMDNMDVF